MFYNAFKRYAHPQFILPGITVVVWMLQVRGQSSNLVIVLSLLAGLLLLKRSIPQALVATLVSATLFSFIWHNPSLQHFAFIATPALVALLIYVAFKKRKRLSLGLLLVLAVLADLALSRPAYRPIFSYPIVDWLNTTHEQPLIYPQGMEGISTSFQSVRYPELISRDFNLMGARFLECDAQINEKQRNVDCQRKSESDLLRIWPPFFLTEEFKDLARRSNLGTTLRQVQQSFPQGFEHSSELELRPRALCSPQGYLFLEVQNGSLHAVLAGPQRLSALLPVLPNSYLNVPRSKSSPGPISLKTDGAPVEIALSTHSSWPLIIALFWLPVILTASGTMISLFNLRLRATRG